MKEVENHYNNLLSIFNQVIIPPVVVIRCAPTVSAMVALLMSQPPGKLID